MVESVQCIGTEPTGPYYKDISEVQSNVPYPRYGPSTKIQDVLRNSRKATANQRSPDELLDVHDF